MEPTTLGALAGFFGAMVTIGVPLLGFLLKLYGDLQDVLAVVEGRDAVEGDGMLARLREVEDRLARVEVSVGDASGVEYDRRDRDVEVDG